MGFMVMVVMSSGSVWGGSLFEKWRNFLWEDIYYMFSIDIYSDYMLFVERYLPVATLGNFCCEKSKVEKHSYLNIVYN